MTRHRRLRAALACLLALALAVVLGGGGCANGGGGSASGGGDDGSNGDVTLEGGETGGEASGCTGGKTMCGSTCTNTGNDPKNCGKCGNACPTGQVCSMGMCGYSCSPGETLCGVNEGGTPAMDASGATETGSSGEAGEAGESDATVSDAAGGTMDAGGPSQPYCANTGNDNNNCGGCGIVCGTGQTCQSGSCACGQGEKICIASGTCIPSNSCCNSGDCAIPGEICPMPGGQCACPGGERECSVTNSCISTNSCCKPTDCTVAGSTCTTPGQACTCSMTGYKACLAFNACLPNADCCTATDCTGAHVKTASCTPSGMPPTSSACGVVTCDPGWYDINGQFSDGCECGDDPLGKACGSPTGVGQLALGQTVSKTGQLPGMGESDWIQVTFSNEGAKAFHALITLATNPNNEFAFDVDSDCSGTHLTCMDGSCSQKTTWEVFYGSQATGNPGDPMWQPISAIGTIYVHVYRVSGAPSCDQYTLNISE
ncbi:MAG TPA: hypothetical protein VF765_31580 [Polyangiaceae bacterium]